MGGRGVAVLKKGFMVTSVCIGGPVLKEVVRSV